MKKLFSAFIGTFVLSGAVSASAQDAESSVGFSTGGDSTAKSSANGSPSESSGEAVDESAEGDNEPGYMKRYIPEGNMWELGLFGGTMFPSKSHALHDSSSADEQRAFKFAGELGVRVAYFPLSFLGGEIEGAVMPSKVKGGTSGGLWAARAHLIGQLPGHSLIPFVLFGGGALGADSDLMGSDVDAAFHFGAGAKTALGPNLSLRLDVRDTLSQKTAADSGSLTHSPEILVGLTFIPRRNLPDRDQDGFADHRDACPSESGEFNGCSEPDTDGDGVVDSQDACPEIVSEHPSGCLDTDGDGVADPEDRCPNEVGTGSGGCPEKFCSTKDSDSDGLTDDRDKCPETAAQTADGCPTRDQDGDGVLDEQDKCIDKAETRNGFQDADGCPDEIPEAVKRFDGVMKGLEFEHASSKVTKGSMPAINSAAKVLTDYPSLKIEIAGHTDNTGDRERNVALSLERADAVKALLVSSGIAAHRIVTLGSGPDKPLEDNATGAGRQKNRRIEFHLVREDTK